MLRIRVVLPFVLAATMLIGCSSSKEAVGAVSGNIVLEGKAVTSGMIAFIAKNGQSYQSEISPDGSYKVNNVPIGEAIVTIMDPPPPGEVENMISMKQAAEKGKDPVSPPPPKAIIPKIYSDEKTTELRYEVKPGDNKWDPPLKK